MKTNELRIFYQSLSNLNNSFTHYSFVWSQFKIDYLKELEENPDTLTKDYFEENPFKSKHNIKFSQLEKEHNKTHSSLIKGIFLLIYSHFEEYSKGIHRFAKDVKPEIAELESKIADSDEDYMLFDKVFNRIGVSKSNLSEEILRTLDYIRIKRNRLIHGNSKGISKSIDELISKYGIKLNNYWNSVLPSQLQGMNFQSKENINELNFNTVIDVINLFRRITKHIDEAIVNHFTEEKILEQVVIPQFILSQGRRLNGFTQEKIISKFIRFCKAEFAIKVNEEHVEILKRSIA